MSLTSFSGPKLPRTLLDQVGGMTVPPKKASMPVPHAIIYGIDEQQMQRPARNVMDSSEVGLLLARTGGRAREMRGRLTISGSRSRGVRRRGGVMLMSMRRRN